MTPKQTVEFIGISAVKTALLSNLIVHEFVVFASYYYDHQVQEDVVGGPCSINLRDENRLRHCIPKI
jgi:hypothetical protein